MLGLSGVAKAIPPRTRDSSLSVGTFMKKTPPDQCEDRIRNLQILITRLETDDGLDLSIRRIGPNFLYQTNWQSSVAYPRLARQKPLPSSKEIWMGCALHRAALSLVKSSNSVPFSTVSPGVPKTSNSTPPLKSAASPMTSSLTPPGPACTEVAGTDQKRELLRTIRLNSSSTTAWRNGRPSLSKTLSSILPTATPR